MTEPVRCIYIAPSFHYDVAYLQRYQDYLPKALAIIDDALDLLVEHPSYRFLIEQVILLEEWRRTRPPERLARMKALAAEERLSVAPGMWVMPDMNHPDGESLFVQARLGREWLEEHLDFAPRVCWIADCWGHHGQLPQIMRQAGYEYYVFFRCMRPDVSHTHFNWRGLDGTSIRAHWLVKSYAGVRFPSTDDIVNAAEQEFAQSNPEHIRRMLGDIEPHRSSSRVLLCNGGDMMKPQASAPEVLARLETSGELPAPLRFATPDEAFAEVDWDAAPEAEGEFNSAFHGTFTSNIRLKQLNRMLTRRLEAAEALYAVGRRQHDFDELWRVLCKQQFHDTICGTLCDGALTDAVNEFRLVARGVEEAFRAADADEGQAAVFNPLPYERTEMLTDGGERLRVVVPALGARLLESAEVLEERPTPELPCTFETPFYRADIDAEGFIARLVEKESGRDLAAGNGPSFGTLAMQIDYGDLWLNFRAPLNGSSVEAAFTDNRPDPFDRGNGSSLTCDGAMLPINVSARCVGANEDELLVEQHGLLTFWQISIPFRTLIRFSRLHRRIEYETTIEPGNKHYRIRAAFPTAVRDGRFLQEIACGAQERPAAEHVAQTWSDYSDGEGGLAVINRGMPGNSLHEGVLMLSLFRAAAMEYKAPSALSFWEGEPHRFEYAIAPHGPDLAPIIREAHAFNSPVEPIRAAGPVAGAWALEPASVVLSGMRPHGEGVFLRLYEAMGRETEAIVALPDWVRAWAPADGSERRTGDWQTAEGQLRLPLRAYEIRGLLLRGE